MRIASWSWGGRHHVGTVSADGREATPLLVDYAGGAALRLLEALAQGESLPSATGPRVAVDAITLRAPVPRPRRNVWCVGRNYHSHAQELSGSVFRDSLPKEHQWPMVFTKFPETVIGPHDAVRLPGKAVSEQIDYESELAVVIGRGGRDIGRARAMTTCSAHHRQRRQRATVRHRCGCWARTATPSARWGRWIVTADELDARHADPRLGHAGGR
jgi:2-keto-4-pentenoate hydratase/2-oxohepta-3-ene-1,7-dioic acid hydratase in catechol pathway